jgi:tRNA 2-thiouridine synthesizing protein A
MEAPPNSSQPPKKGQKPLVADQFLDLQGTQCPMNFVYTKVKLEEMEPGQILHILLDFASAFTSVPHSVKQQNLGRILKEEEKEGTKDIWIQKLGKSTGEGSKDGN